MNRIYQGRISELHVLHDSDPNEVIRSYTAGQLTDQVNPLWQHHEVFQTAINYYFLAFASMAEGTDPNSDSPHEQFCFRLLNRIRGNDTEPGIWEEFPRQTPGRACSMRDMLVPWLGLESNASLDEAFRVVRCVDADPKLMAKALSQYVDEAEGSVRNASKNIEFFIKQEHNKNHDLSYSSKQREWGKKHLKYWVHQEDSPEILRNRLQDVYFSKIDRGNPLREGEDAVEWLMGNIDLYSSHIGRADFENHISRCKADDAFSIPRSAQGALSKSTTPQFAAYVWFAYVDCSLGALDMLRATFPLKDSEKDQVEDYKAKDFCYDESLLTDGELPVEKLRQISDEGYLFKGFTALPAWQPVNEGTPTWIQLEHKACEEALQGLNIFMQGWKTRQAEANHLYGKLSIQIGNGKPKGWSPKKNEEDEWLSVPKQLNPKLLKLAQAIEDRLTNGLSTGIIEMPSLAPGLEDYDASEGRWRVSFKALRDFDKLSVKWQAVDNPDQAKLEAVLKDFQSDRANRKSIGSVPFFLILCEEVYWPLWQINSDSPVDYEDEESTTITNGFLKQYAQLHIDARDYKKAKISNKLTSAEPRYSPRHCEFSAIEKGKASAAKNKILKEPDHLILPLIEIQKQEGRVISATRRRVKCKFTAPRMKRDQVGDSEWLQPMLAGMGISLQNTLSKQPAIELMPRSKSTKCGFSEMRYLINFAQEVDTKDLRDQIGASKWIGSFNGMGNKIDGTRKFIHLNWPSISSSKWYYNGAIQKCGFSVLSIDLGQRTAGAWAMIHIAPKRKKSVDKNQRLIGEAGGNYWYAQVQRTGMLRLPGEDQKVIRRKVEAEVVGTGKTSRRLRELSGSAGRNADILEYESAVNIATKLGATRYDIGTDSLEPDAKAWVGDDRTAKSLPEQNDALIKLASRKLSRLNTYHRWSCLADILDKDPNRLERVFENLIDELARYRDAEVKNWQPKTMSVESIAEFAAEAGRKFIVYREYLLPILLEIANRTMPLRDRCWAWQEQPNNAPYGELVWDSAQNHKAKIQGQRGLSTRRIDQLENMRRLFLRYNRSLDKEPGKRALIGFDESAKAGEPGQLILQKIDHIKQQRINQTAHQILARTLGVELKDSKELSDSERRKGDHHGEYQVINDPKFGQQKPVDMVVIENLDRYLTSQGRGPSENSKLMQWCHRAVRDKLKMLIEEPFGIPVLEAPAAYSSRFCSRTGQPGSRCEELPELRYLSESINEKAEKLGGDWRTIYNQFMAIARHNQTKKGIPRTLLLPKPGGQLFLPAVHGPVFQADVNAAINVGLRAVAAPERIDLLHRIRSHPHNDRLMLGKGSGTTYNKRENAVMRNAEVLLDGEPSKKLKLSAYPNFFHLAEACREHYSWDTGRIDLLGEQSAVMSGISMHTITDELVLKRVVVINAARLDKWNIKVLEDGNDLESDKIPGL